MLVWNWDFSPRYLSFSTLFQVDLSSPDQRTVRTVQNTPLKHTHTHTHTQITHKRIYTNTLTVYWEILPGAA